MTSHGLITASLPLTTLHVGEMRYKLCQFLHAASIIHRYVLCILWGCLSISFPRCLCTQNPTHIEFLLLGPLSLSLSYTHIHKKLWSVDLLICEYGRKAYARGSVLWLWWRSIWFEGYFHIRWSFLQSPLNFVTWVYPYL